MRELISLPVMGKEPSRLRQLRVDRNWTHERAAEEIGVSRGHLIKLERGERRLNEATILRAAQAFGVDPADIIGSRRTVPVVGHVGAGSEAHFYASAQGPFDEIEAPDGSTDSTVAVIVRGDSLGSFFDQWTIFYDDVRTPPTANMLGKLCVIGLPDDRILVKKLMKSTVPGLFTLLSQFEPPIYDVPIMWAALVRSMAPR